MKFKEICDTVFEGKWVRWHKDDEWVRFQPDGTWKDERGIDVIINRAVFAGDQWEVKPIEIFVWGVCYEHDNNSYIFSEEPKKDTMGVYQAVGEDDFILKPFTIPIHGLFSTNKPQKYKLVPVDET